MLLSVSGEKAGLAVDLEVVTDNTKTGDAGVPHGEELLAFATAANQRSADLGAARERLRDVVGEAGLLEASATVGIFNGLVRVADGTGIQLDPSMLTSTVESRASLGIDEYAGAANSVNAPTDPRHEAAGVSALFA
jgi:hypothetical protein